MGGRSCGPMEVVGGSVVVDAMLKGLVKLVG